MRSRHTLTVPPVPELSDGEVDLLVARLARAAAEPEVRPGIEQVMRSARARVERRRARRRSLAVGLLTAVFAVATPSLRWWWPAAATPGTVATLVVAFGVIVLGMWHSELRVQRRRGYARPDSIGRAAEIVVEQARLLADRARELEEPREALGRVAATVRTEAVDHDVRGHPGAARALERLASRLDEHRARVADLVGGVARAAGLLAEQEPARLAREYFARLPDSRSLPVTVTPRWVQLASEAHTAAASAVREVAVSVPFVLDREGAEREEVTRSGEVAERLEGVVRQVDVLALATTRVARRLLQASDDLSRIALSTRLDTVAGRSRRRVAAHVAAAAVAGIIPGGRPRLVPVMSTGTRRPTLRRAHRRRLRRIDSRAAFLATISVGSDHRLGSVGRAAWVAAAHGFARPAHDQVG